MRRIFMLLILFTHILFAHKLNVFVYDENNTLYIYGYFTKSSPCKNCEVTIKNNDGGEIVNLFTDDNGKASIQMPDTTFAVGMNGGMGHYQEVKYVSQSNEQKDDLSSNNFFYKILLALSVIVSFGLISLFLKRIKK